MFSKRVYVGIKAKNSAISKLQNCLENEARIFKVISLKHYYIIKN